MKRREFLAGMSAASLQAAPKQPKNVLLIYCEQFQHNVASFAGGPAKTPNLESLAAQSVNFQSACTITGLCTPARSGLFTGRWGHRTGMDDNCGGWHSRLLGLDDRQTTLIDWAHRKNFFIGYYGKWHLGKDGPIRRGADRYPAFGFERRKGTEGKSPYKPDFNMAKPYYEKGRVFAEKPGFYMTAKGSYETSEPHKLAEQGAAFLAEAGTSRPFFLTVSFNAVHPPYNVPAPYNTMYDWRTIDLPSNLHDRFEGKPAYQPDVMWPFHDLGHMSEDDWRRSNAFYRGDVTLLDRAIGELIDALKSNRHWDDTMLVVLADHGDMNGAHGRYDKGPYCYDEIMRIPLLVHIPGIAPREVSRQVASMDINRTVAEWAGLEPDIPNVDSRSLIPLMERGNGGWNAPDEAWYNYEWYNGLWFGIRAIRTPDFKYCFNPSGPDELYDLKKDPGEMTNLTDNPKFQNVQQELQKRLLAHLEKIEDRLLYPKLKAAMG
jgi:arylsulfatase A-like enzyme